MNTELRNVSDVAEPPFETGIIEKIECGAMYFDGGMATGLPDNAKDWAQAGMTYALWGERFGYIRGIAIDGKVCRYETQEESRESRRKESAAADVKRRADFEAGKDEYFARIAALPDVFQRRIAKFQTTNPDFDWEYGGYELMCCEQAVVFAEALKTPDALESFCQMGWEDQKQAVPAIEDGHSGNSFGFAVRLARWFLTELENVVLEHGALTPLVGCEAYGCPHPADTEGQGGPE